MSSPAKQPLTKTEIFNAFASKKKKELGIRHIDMVLPEGQQMVANIAPLLWKKHMVERLPRDDEKNFHRYRYFNMKYFRYYTCKHHEDFTPWCEGNEGVDDANGRLYKLYELSNLDTHCVCKKICVPLLNKNVAT
jgi:hypothetical protein